uniref:Coiled-coil domain containing 158 n=1 Tax=Leptobrachium leishanense TaxID=445787 RepID=A0A8C5LXX5_9ANUR
MEGKNLQALRHQLEGQTREIQRLQKEVEQATQRALNSLSASDYGCQRLPNASHHCPSTDDKFSPLVSNAATLSLPFQHNRALHHSLPIDQLGCARRTIIKDGLERNNFDLQQRSLGKSLDEYVLRFKDSQETSKEIRNMFAPQSHHTRWTTEELHCKSQKLEKERDVPLGMSPQESKTGEDAIKQLYDTVQQLQKANHLQNELLKQSHICNEFLREAVQDHVGVLQDITTIIIGYEDRSGRKVFDQGQGSNPQISILPSAVNKVLKELETETSKFHPAQEQINILEDKEGFSSLYKEREDLKVQCSQYLEKIAQLELTMSQLHSQLQCAKDKEKELEQHLLISDAALSEARTKHSQDSQKEKENLHQLSESLQLCEKHLLLEKEQSRKLQDETTTLNLCNEQFRKERLERSMEMKHLHTKIDSLKEDNLQQTKQQTATLNEKNENIKFITSQLVSTQELLAKSVQELKSKVLSLENAERAVKDLKSLLDEKERTLRHTKDKIKKLCALTEVKTQEAEHFKMYVEKMEETQKDLEKMRVHLAEKDHFIKSLQLQAENLFQAVGQQTEKINILQGERSQLLVEMKANKEKRDTKIHELEQEKNKLSNDLTIERERLLAELKDTHHNLKNLEVDYQVLQRNSQMKNEEFETTSASLKKQLLSALVDLDHAKNCLRTVEGCDGRAIKVALKMQKKITAKREKIDALQSRIQFLEEALSQANKNRHLKVVKDKVAQEYGNAERCRLTEELEVLRKENKGLREKNLSTQASMDKAALRFSEYQAIIQHLEQESMRLRLKHALELKELRVPSSGQVTAPISIVQSTLVPLTHCDPQLKLANGIPMCGEDRPSKNLLAEKKHACDVMDFSEKLSFKNVKKMTAHTIKEDFHDEIHMSLDPSILHTADLRDKDSFFSFAHTESPFLVAPCYTSSPKKCCNIPRSEAKSPVHSLLTTPVEVVSTLSRRSQSKNIPSQDTTHGEPSREDHSDTPQNLQHRLEKLQNIAKGLHIKNKGELCPE